MHDLCYNYVIIDLNKDLQGWLKQYYLRRISNGWQGNKSIDI